MYIWSERILGCVLGRGEGLEGLGRREGSYRAYLLQMMARTMSKRVTMMTEFNTTITATAQVGMVRVTLVGSLLNTSCVGPRRTNTVAMTVVLLW